MGNGATGSVWTVAQMVEGFISSLFRAAISSEAANSAVCEGNSTILYDDIAVIKA
jgi:hypothetical protein